MAVPIQDQAKQAVGDLTGFAANLTRADTWARGLIAVIVVGLVFVFALKGLSRLGGTGKKIASKVL